MTGKIKRRCLRCGGRPKADFGSLFTSVVAPALNATGSIVDESINNNKTATNGVVNSNTTIPSDPTKTPTMRLGGRKKCWIGAAIGAATSIAGSLFGNGTKKREMRRQKSIQDWQTATQEAAAMSSALNNSQDYQEDYLRQFRTAARLGKTLGAKGIYITDGGDATKIGNNTYLLRGGSHEDVNETGQTGIGINVGGNEVEAEGGEVAQKKNGALRIFSAQPILGNGMSPAQAILRGYNKDKVFNAQQAFKRRNGLKDDGGKAKHGTEVPYKRIHINEDGTFTDTLTGKNSNSTGIADAFKNPDDGISNGYIGKLLYDFDIDKTKPIADQLRQARMKIVRGGRNNVFAGSKYYDESINDARRKGAVAVEDNYGRSNGDVLNVTERAYFPGSAKQNKLTLQNLEEYLAQENKRGRWNTNGVNKMKGDEELFIPRQYNLFDDYIREARIFMKPKREYNPDKERKFMRELTDRMWARSKYRNSLIDMSRRLRRRNEPHSTFFDINKKIPLMDFDEPFRFGGRCKLRNGGLTSKDRGSSKHPYPSVSSKDFAGGGGRSYPIPTKADAVDALRLAGLHGRSDVRSKVYSKYPSLRKKSLLGSCSRPVKGMRHKAAKGIFVPYNKRYTSIYDAPDYDSDYNGGNVLGNGEVTVTAKRIKPTFMKPNNDAMNIIKVPKEEEVPYIPQRHNRSRTIFSGGDYLGLGIDTLAALSTGLVNYNTAGKYVLPDRAPIIQASKLPTTYNVNPEIEEVKRYRDRLIGQTFNNTSSSVAALNRSSAINLDALSNLSKLWATKENEENKMLTEDAKNQQTVAAQNAQNELARQSEIARIKNEATQAKGDALNVGLSGLSQAWTNFWTAGRTAYEDDQSRRAMIASSKDATPTRLMGFDFDLSPDVIAALYRSATEDKTKRFYLSRLSPKQRQKYGIN